MKIALFTFYYPPDLCAGSFRAIALAKALSTKLDDDDVLHIITSHPNRYASHSTKADDLEVFGKVSVHRISVHGHQSGMVSQALTFVMFAFSAYKLSAKLKPDFYIGTTGRLMTGVLTYVSARLQRQNYYIDLRDIFSETISDIFTRKSPLLGNIAKFTFSLLERQVLNGAAGVNVVSEGFPEYFESEGIDTTDWSFFPNGVDPEFINIDPKSPLKHPRTIVYAGNIGNGQGLEKIIPETAKRIGNDFRFVVVGDGGTIGLLKEVIMQEDVSNVELLSPVERTDLIKYYQEADILFLHLNDLPAFRRVLPSKIFEYVALGKPIVAGLNGYSAHFLKKNVPHACLFNPCDSVGAKSSILEATNLEVSNSAVSKFVEEYSRTSIMERMAQHLMGIIQQIR